jgi:hypothetical protein
MQTMCEVLSAAAELSVITCRATISESVRNKMCVPNVWSYEAVLEYWCRQKKERKQEVKNW